MAPGLRFRKNAVLIILKIYSLPINTRWLFFFPDEDPREVLKRELQTLTVRECIRTVKDLRFPNRSEMREFGKVYKGAKEVYIKIRVELLPVYSMNQNVVFVMSFHFAERPFNQEYFPYQKEE